MPDRVQFTVKIQNAPRTVAKMKRTNRQTVKATRTVAQAMTIQNAPRFTVRLE